MYAIIEVGAKQYQVKKGDTLEVEKLAAQAGKELVLDKVLLVSGDKALEIGRPYVKGAKVHAQVVKHTKAEKVLSFKYRRRKSSHWKKGHRQQLTCLLVKDISLS